MAKIQASVLSVHSQDTSVSVECTWAKIQASVLSVHGQDTGVSVECTWQRSLRFQRICGLMPRPHEGIHRDRVHVRLAPVRHRHRPPTEPHRGSRSLWCALGLARLEAVQHRYDTGRPHASFGHITRPRTPTTKPRTRPGPARRPLPGPPRTGPPTIATTNPTRHQHTRLTRLVDTCGDNDHRRVPLIGSATARLLLPWLTILDLRRSLRATVTHSGVPRANAQPHRCATPQRESLHPRASPVAGSRHS